MDDQAEVNAAGTPGEVIMGWGWSERLASTAMERRLSQKQGVFSFFERYWNQPHAIHINLRTVTFMRDKRFSSVTIENRLFLFRQNSSKNL
jgi:hypothetical protein